ncbi:unnamed protein product [Clonostachys rhizophaga]|uniref:Uncharacterized protein n=1 Tax=Clonostachys rhizophaga TaxID=160324 RepID=A0A9N9VDA8_9HYPO|nr:unnamed protein product [Clonostachys rhizophaga]
MGAEADVSEGPAAKDGDPRLVDVAPRGDIVLDVTFETSPETLKKCRKAAQAAAKKRGPSSRPESLVVAQPAFHAKVRVAYRASLDALMKHSKYFANLLSNPHFQESKLITDAHARIASQDREPKDVEASELPWIPIADDDEATRMAGRESIFEDLLLILHGKSPKATHATMAYVTTLAITADRFDCAPVISHGLKDELKFKWPNTRTRPYRDDAGRLTDVEQTLRQKILASWLLNRPVLQASTKELILRGSRIWYTFNDGEADADAGASWWNLSDGLEYELQYRRECILNTIASVQRHFLDLYSSRERQCKLGYDSSAACDSFQLGQMLKFLLSKNLAFLVDFSPSSLDSLPDASMLDIEDLLSTLKQCPNYQIDKHHTNCGLRIRIEPIVDYIRAMLSSDAVFVSPSDWSRNRAAVSWASSAREADGDGRAEERPGRAFAFTRALANDPRLRYENTMYAGSMAKKLFLAESWDWTPEI